MPSISFFDCPILFSRDILLSWNPAGQQPVSVALLPTSFLLTMN